MKALVASLFTVMVLALPAQAQTLLFEEDFEGGDADWVDVDRNAVNYSASGGHDGGAYISVTENINTSSGGNFGGYTLFRCAVAPSQLPSQDCSGGGFVGDYYFTEGVQQLTFWFRHNSTKSGGLTHAIRLARPGNATGGSSLSALIPANTWTQVTVNIDPQDSAWDQNWGSLQPDAVTILRDIGRLQPGFYVDPLEPTYTESNVTFDLDDVQLLGQTTTLTAEIIQEDTLHPHHNDPPAFSFPDDPIKVVVIGESTGAGDPEDIDTDDIVSATVRVGRLGGSAYQTIPNINKDGDGIDDVRYRVRTGPAFGDRDVSDNCYPTWRRPTTLEFRAEMVTGEIVAGEDTSLTMNCNANCH